MSGRVSGVHEAQKGTLHSIKREQRVLRLRSWENLEGPGD